ncbi:MAG: hypothetical protein KAJ15_07985 [Spirochaetes bacterium]|nr:hypothetical protein [Spirochaetota bacterium]
MADKYIIASDLGSQSVKTAIYDIEGRSIGTFTQDTKIHTKGHGALVYYGDEFYQLTTENIRFLVKKLKINPKYVAAMSFSGMGGGIIGVDENWTPTSEYTNPLDCRDQPCFSKVMLKYGDLIRSKSATGSPMAANKIVWLKETYPEKYKKSKKFMIVTQYVQGKLAGTKIKDAFWENTSSAFTGLADVERFQWSDEICKALEIDIDKLPKLINPTDIIGTLTKEAATDCGLIEGVQIVAGAFDKPCDTLGSGSNEVGSIVDNAATYPAITVCVDKFTSDMEHKTLECHPSAIKGLWLLETYITGGGLTHKWFRDNFCIEEKISAEKTGTNVYNLLDEKASKIPPGAEGLLFIPHLSGRATPYDPEIRGLWVGFTWTHGREHFYRSILESIAYEHACSIKVVINNYPNIVFNQVTVLGGGSVSGLWNQIKADVLGLPYIRLNRGDFATLGAAIIGGKAVGLFKDMQATAKRFSEIHEKYQPKTEIHNYYLHYIDTYNKMFKDLKNVYNQLYQLSSLPIP